MSGTVLIIDDSELVREHVQKTLLEHQVTDSFLCASNGVEGFKLLVENQVALVLCDVIMPGFDGFKFLSLKASRDDFNDVPVIMLTGKEDVQTKVRGLHCGALDYLTKPFHDEELVARVLVHLRLKSLQDELRQKNLRLEELSRTDELTRLANRRHFMESYRLEFMRARRYGSPLAYLMVDVDHFKAVNDDYGHQAGDAVLVTVAQCVQRDLRQFDLAGRYGGEEFAVLLPQTRLDGAHAVAERARQAVAETPVEFAGESISVTVSIGLASVPQCAAQTPEELIQLADAALYRAKDTGRNCVVLAEMDTR